MTATHVLVVLGAACSIGSALLIGFRIAHHEKIIVELEKKIFDFETRLVRIKQLLDSSYQRFYAAQMQWLVLHATSPPADFFLQQKIEAVKNIIHGIMERTEAAGFSSDEEKFHALEAVGVRAAHGDASAMQELSGISSDLLLAIVNHNNAIANEKIGCEMQRLTFKRKVSFCHRVAVALQILGLIIVLSKDVLSQ